MGLLGNLFGIKKQNSKQYMDAGLALIHKLVISLNLPNWDNLLPTYNSDELEAINKRLSEFQEIANNELGGEAKFHPEVVPKLQRMLSAEVLAEYAGKSWKYSDEVPTNWRDSVATYFKSWASQPNPFVLLELADLLVKAGYRSEAKDTLSVVLLFPTYADIYYSNEKKHDLVDSLIRSAHESLKDLD